MDKRHLHHYYTRLRRVKPWYFLLAAAVFFALAIYGLRQNNLTMLELRQEVTKADKNDGDVEKALSNLRDFVYRHMNTDLSSGSSAINPPIQLKYKYERLLAKEEKAAKKANESVKRRAEQTCGAKYPAAGYNSPRVSCVQKYVRQNASQPSDNVPEDLYKFDFASPGWTPDFAGVTLALSSMFFVVFLAWLALLGWLKAKTRN